MGNLNSLMEDSHGAFPYCVSHGIAEHEDCTAVYRCAMYPDQLTWQIPDHPMKCGWDIFQVGKQRAGPNSPFIGSRIWRKAINETLLSSPPGEPEYLTYQEFEDLAIKFGAGLVASGLARELFFESEKYVPARRLRPLGLFCKNRVEWFVAEQASNAFGLTLVPLYDTLGESAIRIIISECQLELLLASVECAAIILNLLCSWKTDTLEENNIRLRNIVIFDRPDNDFMQLANKAEIQITFWKELVARGDAIGLQNIRLQPPNPEDVCTINYTSGTTGNPKGVLVTAQNFVANVAAASRCCLAHPQFQVQTDDLHISYLPLAHIFERIIVSCVIRLGARIGVYSGDTQKLLDDMKIIQPTIFLSVPRLYMRINDKIQSAIAEKSAVAEFLFNTALEVKIKKFRKTGVFDHAIWDRLVFGKLKRIMGGRLRFMIVGGAPMDAAVQERMSIIFCCPLLHGYGMTELGTTIIALPGDPVAGHIGGVQPCNEFLLRSVPEMNYLISGDPPMGELLVRGFSVTPGYFLNEEETKAAFWNGFLQTGDIVALLPGGALKVVDRKKNIFKLAQGEYVAPEKIELVYLRSLMVGQVFVYGNPLKTCLVAIVVPDEEEAARWASKNDMPFQGLTELCKSEHFSMAVLNSMIDVGEASGLKGFEKVKRITLEAEPFTIENGLLTSTLKLKRHYAREKYQSTLDTMYSTLE